MPGAWISLHMVLQITVIRTFLKPADRPMLAATDRGGTP